MPTIKYKGITYGGGSSGTDIILDTKLDLTSENGVQNKVITAALNDKANKSDLEDKLNVTDIADWAKAGTKPTYTYDEVGADKKGAASAALTSAQSYTDVKLAM